MFEEAELIRLSALGGRARVSRSPAGARSGDDVPTLGFVMKLVQTLLVRDEADIVDTQIAYHLNAGVDFVIATDHESRDGTTEILESYARDGHLRRIPMSGEMLDGPGARTWRGLRRRSTARTG